MVDLLKCKYIAFYGDRVSAVIIFLLNVTFTFFVDNITLFFMYSLGDFSQSTVFCQVLPKLRGQLEAFPVQNYEKSSSH